MSVLFGFTWPWSENQYPGAGTGWGRGRRLPCGDYKLVKRGMQQHAGSRLVYVLPDYLTIILTRSKAASLLILLFMLAGNECIKNGSIWRKERERERERERASERDRERYRERQRERERARERERERYRERQRYRGRQTYRDREKREIDREIETVRKKERGERQQDRTREREREGVSVCVCVCVCVCERYTTRGKVWETGRETEERLSEGETDRGGKRDGGGKKGETLCEREGKSERGRWGTRDREIERRQQLRQLINEVMTETEKERKQRNKHGRKCNHKELKGNERGRETVSLKLDTGQSLIIASPVDS